MHGDKGVLLRDPVRIERYIYKVIKSINIYNTIRGSRGAIGDFGST